MSSEEHKNLDRQSVLHPVTSIDEQQRLGTTASGCRVTDGDGRDYPFLDVTSFSPPLTISRTEIDAGIERFGRALDEARPELDKLANGA